MYLKVYYAKCFHRCEASLRGWILFRAIFLLRYQRTGENRKNRITIYPTFRKRAIRNSARRYRPAIIDRRRPIVFRDGTLRAFNRSGQIFVITFQFLPAKEENWFYRLRLWCSSCRQCSPSSLEEKSEIGNRRKWNRERRRKKRKRRERKNVARKRSNVKYCFILHFHINYWQTLLDANATFT